MIKLYNRHMGGLDRCDQNISSLVSNFSEFQEVVVGTVCLGSRYVVAELLVAVQVLLCLQIIIFCHFIYNHFQ